MSEIINSLKDVVNPKRREEATAPTYNPEERGPSTTAPEQKGHPQVAPPSHHTAESLLEGPDGSSPKVATNVNLKAKEGTYGPHKSRIANFLDPRVDSDRDGRPAHGTSDLGSVAGREASK